MEPIQPIDIVRIIIFRNKKGQVAHFNKLESISSVGNAVRPRQLPLVVPFDRTGLRRQATEIGSGSAFQHFLFE